MHAAHLAPLCAALIIISGTASSQDAFLDKQSAYPGEIITVHASIPGGNRYSVSVKRSLGFRSNVEVLRSPGLDPGTQSTFPGSYAWAPHRPSLDLRDEISLEAWVRPTRGANFQGVLTRYGTPGDEAYRISLMPSNRLSFYLGRGQFSVENRLLTSSPLPLRQWTHVAATWDGQTKRIYVNGRLDVSQGWTGPILQTSQPVRIASCGNRGSADDFFSGHIDSPAIYDRALTPAEIQQRFAEKANYSTGKPGVLSGCVAQWNFGELGGTLLRDVTGNGHDLTLVNNATRGVAGPAPRASATASHAIRFAQDDLFNPAWEPAWSFTVPATWPAGFYTADVGLVAGGYRIPFVVKPLPSARTKIAVLVATATWTAYNAWSGNSMYTTHADGTIAYYVGMQQPNPGARVDLHSPGGGITHLTDAERYLYSWLRDNHYEFDLYTDFDLHRDPSLLDGYEVLMLNGHSEYWSHEMIDHVEAFQDAGGSVVNLSGNTMWSLVTFNSDFTVMEGRKHPHGSGTIPAAERWHSTGGGVLGGTMRCIGRPEHEVIGTGYGIGGGGARGWCVVRQPAHWVFAGTGVSVGDRFGTSGLNGGAMMGFEVDVVDPAWTPPNTEVIAVGNYPTPTFQLGITNCQTRTSWNTLEGGEVIYFDHPGGGGVFGIPSVTVGGSLAGDPIASQMLRNVLDRFLEPSANCVFRNGSGINPLGFICTTRPIVGATWMSSVPTTAQTTSTLLGLSATPAQTALFGGEILVGLVPEPLFQQGSGTHAVVIPNSSTLLGAAVYAQGFRFDGADNGSFVLFNAQDLTLGR